MADKPGAEVRIDAGLVRALLVEQRPDLAGLPLSLASEGWDNATWRLGPSLAVRLPRRAASAVLALHEQRCLPVLAETVDVAIPVPVHAGVPGAGYPWHWSVVPYLDGRPAATVEITRRAAAATDLALFVAQLHQPAPPDAPHNPYRGVDLARRSADVHARVGAPSFPRAEEARALWEALSAAPAWTGPALWLHGDLHPFNILLTTDPGAGASSLSAVIDFGDVSSGDPATDLATAWLTFDPVGRRSFVTEVTARCGTDTATWRRARAWALLLATAMLAHSDDDPPFAALGRAALDQVLADDGHSSVTVR